MKRLSMFLICLFAMTAASLSAKAQEITIDLWPGWNWISYPNAEPMDVVSALGSFVPAEGDIIQAQWTNANYRSGRWKGGLTHFMPGLGYKYYSNREEIVSFVFNKPPMPTGTLSVTTGELANITSTTAVCGGSAVSNDGTSILMKGVCWATHPQPTTNDSYTEDGSGPGAFTAEMTELAAETEYYVRAYAVSVKGINYGEELSFITAPEGVLNGLFSVSENTQVCFSQGNLQYQASTNTWRFAEHQWNFVGEGNLNASSTYDNWIDLFAWATSNYEHASNGYQPWSEGCNAYDGELLNLCDRTGKADWGYNAISNGGNEEKLWRTCTDTEWVYLMNNRQTASGIRFVKANINEINGIILLPDNWDATLYSLNNPNDGVAAYSDNAISLETWMSVFEANGAVFLPAAGRKQDWANNDFNECGVYWYSTSHYVGYLKGRMIFGGDSMELGAYYTDEHYSVRLVRSPQGATYSIEAVSNPADAGTVEGSGIYDYYASANLTAIPNEGYTFICWKENGRVVSTDNTYEVLALFNRNLEACFFENSTYPLTYSYNEEDHTATVIGRWDGVELTGELVIPETVMHNGETYTVTVIGDNAFNGCSNLTSVVFPSSLVSIGGYAFNGCSGLTSVEFNSIESIGEHAFRSCHNITEIIIPATVNNLGVNPFLECNSLSQITVEAGNANYDSRDNCNAIIETHTNKLVSGCLTTIIPNTVTDLGKDAFAIVTITSIYTLAETPPTVGINTFVFVDKSIPVYVPCSSIEAYQNASGWNEFTNFIAVGNCSGMVTVTASPAEYGTVTGGGYYENSATCTVTATPNEGYYFLCWKEDGQWVSSQATYSFPVYRDRNLTAVFTIGAENIINGDFEQGNVGFTSEYYYDYDFGPGEYYVDNNGHGYPGFGHGGTGNFMMIDAATEPGVIVWSEQVSVEPNTYYTFSSWACTLNQESRALLQLSINGTQVGDVFTAPSQTNTWEQFNALWYSGNSTTATITIVDQNTEYMGNDFGLDDISFREFDPSVGGDHAYVDLGLPSGLLWATCNVGAVTPEDYGDYFAWGETQPKVTYDWSTYQYCNGSYNTLTKYCNNSDYGYNGFTDNLTTLLPEDDAATANWGSDWRMPTKEEWEELYTNTTVTWTQQNGVNGRLFTAANGNILFLPAVGWNTGSPSEIGSFGIYWSSSLFFNPDISWTCVFNTDDCIMYFYDRANGQSVRPVRSSRQN